jgi:hypothetical protein
MGLAKLIKDERRDFDSGEVHPWERSTDALAAI